MNPRVKGRKGRSSEIVDENAFAKCLESMGIWSEHMSNPENGGGWPDRYLGNGLWIEFKAFLFTRKEYRGRPPALHKMLRRSQKRMIPALLAAGDRVLVCTFIHNESEKSRFIIHSYTQFLDINEKEVDEQSLAWNAMSKDTKEYISERIQTG